MLFDNMQHTDPRRESPERRSIGQEYGEVGTAFSQLHNALMGQREGRMNAPNRDRLQPSARMGRGGRPPAFNHDARAIQNRVSDATNRMRPAVSAPVNITGGPTTASPQPSSTMSTAAVNITGGPTTADVPAEEPVRTPQDYRKRFMMGWLGAGGNG